MNDKNNCIEINFINSVAVFEMACLFVCAIRKSLGNLTVSF